MGQEVSVQIPALQNKEVKGRVSFISPLANFATKNFTQDRSSFDLKTFELRISIIDAPAGIRPGMTAVVVGKI